MTSGFAEKHIWYYKSGGPMKVGEKIQRIRKERGYTADQLAEMLGGYPPSPSQEVRVRGAHPEGPHDGRISPLPRGEPLLSNPIGKRRERCDTRAVRAGGSILPRGQSRVGDTVVLWLFRKTWAARTRKHWRRALRHWHRNNRDLKDGRLTRDEYVAWKDSFKA